MTEFNLGDHVAWHGERGTILGLTTEPSAIVQLPNRSVTVGLSNLTRVSDPAPAHDLTEANARLRLLADICNEAEDFEHSVGRRTPQWIHDVRGTLRLQWPDDFQVTA